jgi:hypothetical protein
MITRYVDPDAAVGGNGTTNALSGANCAYVSLNVWEAARQAILGDIEECICESNGGSHTADPTAVVIDGWTTTAAFYIDIKTSAAARHAGVWGPSVYRHEGNAEFGAAVEIREAYWRVTGLIVENSSGDGSYCIQWVSPSDLSNSDALIDTCLLVGQLGGASPGFGGLFVQDGKLTVRNTVSYRNDGDGFYIALGDVTSGQVTFENCAANGNGGRGFHIDNAAINATRRNSYAGGNVGNDWNGSWDTTQTCASEDGTGGSTIAYSTSSGAFFTNITPGSEDFHIGASSSLLGAGTDLSGSFTLDFDGETRVDPWSIGPDDIIESEPPPPAGRAFFVRGRWV